MTARVRFGVALLACAGLVLAGCGQAGAGGARNYPRKQIQYVIPFDPGGESDVTARIQQQALEKAFGQSVVVTNRPGGGGAVGWSKLAHRTRPDGYTIMGANLPHVVLQPLAREDAGYETEDIKWAYIFETTPGALVVAKDSPHQSLKELIAAAKKKPGKVTIGGSAKFSANHMGTLALEQATGIDVTYVPFSGTAAATPALLGGQVDALMSYNTAALDMKNKGARVLGVVGDKRLPKFPNAPTFAELGYNVEQGSAWRGVAVPPRTPDAVVDKIAQAFAKVNKNPRVRKKMRSLGFELVNMGPEKAEAFTQQRAKKAERLLRNFGLVSK